MSKTSKRKSGGESSKISKSLSLKDSHKRPSVFERLGTKASSISLSSLSVNVSNQLEFCRAWAQNGTCPFGKSCKLSYSHTLISPSKRSVKKEELEKRVQNTLVQRGSPSEICVDWESWDQSELEYEDEKALERRRQLLQRELELQLKKESQKQETNKRRSSSTSSDSSSTSSSTTSSGSSSDSSVSTKKKSEPKIQSPSFLERSIIIRKTMGKLHKDTPPRKTSASRKLSPQRKASRRKSDTPVRKQMTPPSKPKTAPLNRSSERGSRRNERNDTPPTRRSPERKQLSGRSSGSSRRSPRPSVQRRGRSPRPRPPSRNRTPDRRKEDDRRGKDDTRRGDRKTDFRDKREAAREKERVEALERCRERQREREALAKERERERKERDKRRRGGGGYTSSSGTTSRRSPPREEKRHDRKVDRERSYSRERARDRALERVMERRGSSRERSYERPYVQNSPSYRGGNDRNRYGSERVSSERGSTREERRGGRRWVESREKQSGSREWSEHADWENRSRCEERADEWCGYSGPTNRNEWRARSHLSHHDERNHHPDKEKDHSSELSKEKESKDLNITAHSKRSGDDLEMEVTKRPRLDEVLQEELSDISDDPDDILNREDEVSTDRDVAAEEAGDNIHHDNIAQLNPQEDNIRPPTPAAERNIDTRIDDDVSLDFEEISDEELEEESKSNKGVSVVDALGVDWASLVAEWRPPRDTVKKGSARANWSTEAVFRRIGISADLAGEQLYGRISKTYISDEKNTIDAKTKCLPSTLLQNKQALSARTDIIIRRQLCGLPVISSETHPTTGLCQWAV